MPSQSGAEVRAGRRAVSVDPRVSRAGNGSGAEVVAGATRRREAPIPLVELAETAMV